MRNAFRRSLWVLVSLLLGSCSSGSSESDSPAPVARELAFQTQPVTILVNGHFRLAPTVQVQDTDGAVATNSAATVQLHLLAGSGPGAVTGPASSAASHGVASFPGLSIDQPGSYTLVATAAGLDSAVSAPFTVQPLPLAADVQVGTAGGAIRFRSVRNGSSNPAVDTIASGGTVTWLWLGDGHTVHATDGNFASSSAQNAPSQWVVNFIIPQVYRFDCAIHGAAMTGQVVVQ